MDPKTQKPGHKPGAPTKPAMGSKPAGKPTGSAGTKR